MIELNAISFEDAVALTVAHMRPRYPDLSWRQVADMIVEGIDALIDKGYLVSFGGWLTTTTKGRQAVVTR